MAWALEQDRDAHDAWTLFHRVFSRLTVEAHVAGIALEKVAGDRDPDSFAELMARFGIIYDALCPPPDDAEKTTDA